MHHLVKFEGKPVFVRTVTHHYTGRLGSLGEPTQPHLFIELTDAAWIADDGRFADALKDGKLNEVEPYPDGPVLLGLGAILDISEWHHDLPREQK